MRRWLHRRLDALVEILDDGVYALRRLNDWIEPPWVPRIPSPITYLNLTITCDACGLTLAIPALRDSSPAFHEGVRQRVLRLHQQQEHA